MELINATSATSVITAITGVVTANMGGILALLGFAAGVKLVRGFLNKSTKGRV
jgi:hypothetical protein